MNTVQQILYKSLLYLKRWQEIDFYKFSFHRFKLKYFKKVMTTTFDKDIKYFIQ